MSTLGLRPEHTILFNKDAFEEPPLYVPFYSSHYLLRSTVSAFFLGILFVLTLSSLYILSRKGLGQTSVRVLILATVALFTSTTTFFGFIISAICASNDVFIAALNGMKSTTFTIDHNHLDNLTNTLNSVTVATLGINVCLFFYISSVDGGLRNGQILISDAIVYWRVLIIWEGNIFVKCIFVWLMVATLVFGIVTVYHPPPIYTRQGPLEAMGNFSSEFSGIICMIVSVVGNAIATSLVSYKTWVHWNIVKNIYRTMGSCFLGSQSLSALLMVVESGAVYCIFLVLVVIGNGEAYFSPEGSKLSWFESGAVLLVSTWLIPLVAIYPMLIVVIVALKKSPVDHIQGQISSLVVQGNEGGAEASTLPLSGAMLSHDIEMGTVVGTSGDMRRVENLPRVD